MGVQYRGSSFDPVVQRKDSAGCKYYSIITVYEIAIYTLSGGKLHPAAILRQFAGLAAIPLEESSTGSYRKCVI